MSVTTTEAGRERRGRGRHDFGHAFRPELQALRALAVTLVVVYHVWPNTLTGGYVGVDIFFVISGYLITGQIAKGIERGNFSLSVFYARRAKRLLPASMTVLAAVLIVTVLVFPQAQWVETGRHVLASVLYVENWALAVDAVDYLGTTSDQIVVQHFWSLSVEEQFYVVWPLAFLGCAALATRLRRDRRRITVIVLAVLVTASLVYSIVSTIVQPELAYFNTLTRAWEFGLGGLVALTSGGWKWNTGWTAVALRWGDLALMVISAVVLVPTTPFPGWIAGVPVLGALAFILAGQPTSHGVIAANAIVASRPVQWLGDVSYSVYLWHWPLLLLLPSVLRLPPTTPVKIAIVVLSLALGWLSKILIEDPVRESRWPWRPSDRAKTLIAPRLLRTTAVAAAAMLVLGGAAGTTLAVGQAKTDAAYAQLAATLDSDDPCLGALTLAPGSGCSPLAGSGTVVPDPAIAKRDADFVGCQQSSGETEVITCAAGDEDGSVRVALAGDSHAQMWLPALDEIGEANGWSVTSYLRSGCRLDDREVDGLGDAARCAAWNQAALAQLVAGDYDVVVVSGASSHVADAERDEVAAGIAGAWSTLEAAGAHVVAVRDIPLPENTSIGSPTRCVSNSSAPWSDCALRQEEAVGADVQTDAAAVVEGVTLIDMTDGFCTDGTCPAVVGGVMVYRDDDHMSATYSRTLAPSLHERLTDAGVLP